MSTQGNNGTSIGKDALSQRLRGLGVEFTNSGTVTSISAYLETASANSATAALYSSGDALLATSAEVTTITTAGWYTFTFASPPEVTQGTTYKLVVYGFGVEMHYSSGTGDGYFELGLDYPNFPATIAWDSTNTNNWLIYATVLDAVTSRVSGISRVRRMRRGR